MLRIRLWQWPNLLALDAALIALLWQSAFAQQLETQVSLYAQSVLGLSVWLTYMADRLFDVTKRPLEQLHSLRHCFAKQHTHSLWRIWGCVLIVNITIAFTKLATAELYHGGALLSLCLLYTALNQAFSRKFFPKELCVALIYAGGVIIFLFPKEHLAAPTSTLALLCLINCLMIGYKERQVDAALQVRSMSSLPKGYIFALSFTCALSLGFLNQGWLIPFIPTLGALLILQAYQARLSVEAFRVLTDSALLIGPTITLLIQP